MEWIITSGVIALIVGIALLLDGGLRQVTKVLDAPIAYIDDQLNSIRMIAGVVLVILGGWFSSVAVNYESLWFMHLCGVIAFFFGMLYLFLPGWLKTFSRVADQLVFSTDEYVFAARKTIGIILLIVAGYVFFFVFLAQISK